MKIRSRTQKALSLLLPVGVLGASVALASAHAKPVTAAGDGGGAQDAVKMGVAQRLAAIRSSVSTIDEGAPDAAEGDPRLLLAQWVNLGPGGAGWRNGGWRNAGWGNGGWRNAGWPNGGWRNGGWGNGGWRNWGNGGWGNGGWHNFWHNW